jgi:CAAX protease family protein
VNFKTLAYTPAGGLRAPWRLLIFVVEALVLSSVLTLTLIVPFTKTLAVSNDSWALAAASVVDIAGALGATWFALRWIDKKPWSDVGLQGAAARPAIVGGGFLIGGAAIALPILVLILVGWLRAGPGSVATTGHPIIQLTALLLPAALAEELLTRGYVLTALRDGFGSVWAVALTSVGFGLLHLGNGGADVRSIALVTIAGVFLGVVRLTTGSLYAAWATHFAWNWVMAALFHAPVSGIAFDAPGYRYVDAGPDWATGGAWGPEGGIPAGLVMIVGVGLLLKRSRRHEHTNLGER